MRVCIVAEGCYPFVVGGCIQLDTQHDPLISQYRVCHLGDCGKSLAERQICI